MLNGSKHISIIVLIIFTLLLSACGMIGDEVATLPVTQNNSAVSIPLPTDVQTAANTQANPAAQASAAAPTLAAGQYFEHEQAFINVYEMSSPSVVHIGVADGEGSGFVFDDNGHIVTNNHVVATSTGDIIVRFSDGSQKEAAIVGTAPDSDLAVLKVDASPGELRPLPVGNSNDLRVGQIVVAIGSPFGLENTLTTGIVSGLDRLFPGAQAPGGGTYNIPNIIQTDAAINPGNSGGPLLDLHGNLIGVNTAIESPVRGSSGVGFAVPSNVVAVVIPQLISGGKVATPWLGISGTELNGTLAEDLGLDPTTRGIVIGEVIVGGPAAAAGLQAADANGTSAGDIIVGVDGNDVRAFDDLLGYIVEETTVGQTINVEVLRDGQVETIPLTLQARPSAQ
ncbi:MAG: S1C family serine protease [Candidatus Promineifilaceae bacterium]